MKFKNQNGLTLLEVLISIIVLSIGVLGMAPLMVMTIESNNISRDVLRASELARDQMESLEGLSVLPTLPYKNAQEGVHSDFGGSDGEFNVYTLIEDNTTDTLITEGLCNVTVQVAWIDKMGTRRTSSFTSLLEKK